MYATERCPELALVLMGTGNARYVSSLQQLASRLGVTQRVHFLAPVPPDQVVANARSADLGVVVPQPVSLNFEVSLPNKLFQYLAAGLPVVASDFPELARVIVGHDVGVTCDPGDPQAIVGAIREVTGDPFRNEALRMNAHASCETFNWTRESSKLLATVQGLTR